MPEAEGPRVSGRPAASPLSRAFWGWFVGGGIASLVVGLGSLALVSLHYATAVLAVAVWLAAIPAWAITALVLVWRRGRHAAPRWRWASRAAVLGTYALIGLGVAAIPSGGGYSVKAKVQGAANGSVPTRVALGIACAEGVLAQGLTRDVLGLASAEDYAGRWSHGVHFAIDGDFTATVTVVMRDVPATKAFAGPGVADGQTVVFRGACGEAGMRWEVGGTVDERYLPRM